MRIIGAHERAKDMRRAANRLRTECEPGAERPAYDLAAALGEIAETLGIIHNTLRLLDDADLGSHLGVGPERREEFARMLEFYRRYHEVMR